ncbi:MAG: hypothetical protein C0391_03610 [Anaerolinea sp.]|nr:hypothetical protein [Anaerolinea sp.]
MRNTVTVKMVLIILMSALSGCSGLAPQPTATIAPTLTSTLIPPTATSTPTLTPTPTPIRTPPSLPGTFQSSVLNPLDTPHTYIEDTCQYLKLKWDPNNSAPGTVVMVIMYHSITDDSGPLGYSQINQDYHQLTMQHASELGFMTITPAQLADFLEKNARIPARSMLLLSDDRHQADFFKTHFVPLLKKYEWSSVTMAWISIATTPLEYFDPLQKLVNQGFLDIQAHGVVHNTPITEFSSDDYIRSELAGSIAFIQERFGVTPIAYIWPGGGFTKRGVEIAREVGYRLGFTVNPRGPVMFNWVPLSDTKDNMRLPEGGMGDPLLVLPRYWSTDADYRLTEVISIGDAAAAEAAANRDTELLYYDIVCKDTYGPISHP